MNEYPLNTSVIFRSSFSDDKTLTITNVNRTVRGEYRLCVASNRLGNATSNATMLSVHCNNTSVSLAIILLSVRLSLKLKIVASFSRLKYCNLNF